MESMDSLTSVDNPLTPTAETEQVASPEVLEQIEQLEQIQTELREQVVRAANKGESFDSVERAVWETIRRAGNAALELLTSLQRSGDLGKCVTTEEDPQLRRSDERPSQS